ncbi:MAG: ion transporter [Zetaproteobacteria bacterium CG12_big_fil_rev_8_21_14_0_65_54_13]|nr:MAG: ion transporter [Zetaproteobacteria bacterium CG12_big_fil_rev_8_21_14_0_65_54_13]PIX54466.1 MAG: ion transporter [Zetaproteobacteria bacterium CG_4_10_14_3_um_filter_54_28]PJA26957.1 MAG: ion transporter [Zetaproteobacteria bacterium CG_4_9_14_3_um_filter_54_145]
MSGLMSRWTRRLRSLLIESMRPGRDEQELLAILGRAVAVQSEGQRNMLEAIVHFHDTRVREVMIPRSDIQSVPANAVLADVERIMIDLGISRMPVIDGDIDHVLGMVHVQDIMDARLRDKAPALTDLLRPCLKVLELEQVSGLLSEMREHACRIAIVLDEFGGTAGLVTLSDLVREIIGEIGEDGEDEEQECKVLADGSFQVLARMHIEELAEAVGAPLSEGDYDTVAGWLITKLGRIPQIGEVVKLDGFRIHILEADPRRVSKVRMQRLTQPHP